MRYPQRFYTDRSNRILAERIAGSTCRTAELIARREQATFAELSCADAIDAVDAAYERARVSHPDSIFRELAIDAAVEGRPSFALRPNAPAEIALGALYRGQDLVTHIRLQAERSIGDPAIHPFAERVSFHAGRILAGLVPVNAAARRVLDDATDRLSPEVGRVAA